ncbi:hypothetical protein FN846DRAFT_906370 [Sphaerosporella brunnea]|uniref:Ubiquitin-like domain-containing protein n=1 Tax=Sphaerosporella brunnea TaxID=1250544 RepID=A0A5J5EZZ4_9PEZI|nr:hypothetical protein FN846DRAFT_906370 [Sphaerosporella brunnea]
MGKNQRSTPPDGADIVVVITAHGLIDPMTIRVPAGETLQWLCYLLAHEFGIVSDHIVFIDEEGNSLPPMNHRVANLCYHGLQYQQFPRGWGYRFEAVIDE